MKTMSLLVLLSATCQDSREPVTVDWMGQCIEQANQNSQDVQLQRRLRGYFDRKYGEQQKRITI